MGGFGRIDRALNATDATVAKTPFRRRALRIGSSDPARFVAHLGGGHHLVLDGPVRHVDRGREQLT
jgi:hypothetical protein